MLLLLLRRESSRHLAFIHHLLGQHQVDYRVFSNMSFVALLLDSTYRRR